VGRTSPSRSPALPFEEPTCIEQPLQALHHQKEVGRIAHQQEVHQLGKEADRRLAEAGHHIVVVEAHHTVQVADHLVVDPTRQIHVSFCFRDDSYVCVAMTDIVARLTSWVYLRWIALLI